MKEELDRVAGGKHDPDGKKGNHYGWYKPGHKKNPGGEPPDDLPKGIAKKLEEEESPGEI